MYVKKISNQCEIKLILIIGNGHLNVWEFVIVKPLKLKLRPEFDIEDDIEWRI